MTHFDAPVFVELRGRARTRRFPGGVVDPELRFDETDDYGITTTWAASIDAVDGSGFLVDAHRSFRFLADRASGLWRAWWPAYPQVWETSRRLCTARDNLAERIADATGYPVEMMDFQPQHVSYSVEGRDVIEWLAELDKDAADAEAARLLAWRTRRTLFGRLRDDGISQTDVSILTGLTRGAVARLSTKAEDDLEEDLAAAAKEGRLDV